MSVRKNTKFCTSEVQLRMLPLVTCLFIVLIGGSVAMAPTAQSASAPEIMSTRPQEQMPQNSTGGTSSLPIASVAEAERLLKDVEMQRDSIDARYREEEAKCLTKFFVTSCIDNAKERRRVGLQSVRSIEVQANAFKRAYKAEQRDRELQRKKPSELPRSDLPRSEDASEDLRKASKLDAPMVS